MSEIDDRLQRFCRDRGVEGVVIRRRSNAAWATGGADFHIDAGSDLGIATLVWEPGRKRCFTTNIEAPRLRDEEPLDGWEIVEEPWWEPRGEVEKLLAAGRHASDFPDDPLYELRAELTLAQIEQARALGRDTARVVGRLMREDVKPGMTEHHLGGAAAGWLRDAGIRANVVLVASDERIARYRHPVPSAKVIERVAMLAVCAQRHGLTVSVTRLAHFGPIPDDLRRRHEAVCSVEAALYGATRPGAEWREALAAGVRAYEAAGFGDEWRLHHQGGPMGYLARDFVATPSERRPVRADQLVGWNPSITGTKGEDTILTRAEGEPELITPDDDWPSGPHGRRAILER